MVRIVGRIIPTLVLAVVSALHSEASAAADAVLPELPVTPYEIPDPEYDQNTAQFTFSDKAGNLWIGRVDPVTGEFQPQDGHGILVDTGAAYVKDFGNGPEWMQTAQGPQIVYTKYLDGQPHRSRYAGIGRARVVDGAWQGGFLSDGGMKHSPIASLDENDPNPRICYQGVSSKTFYWRRLDDPATEEMVPGSDRSQGSRRLVEGLNAIIFTAGATDPSGATLQQVFLYHIDTRILEQLTDDPTSKMGAFMWRAPEFDNEYVFYTLVERTKLRLHRKMDANGDGTPEWTAFNTINMPPTLPYIWSPEPFVYKGKSFVFMQLGSSKMSNDMSLPTQLAMTGIDPAHPNFRMLTNDSATRRVRMDPEVIFTAQGPYIYYNRYLLRTAERHAQPDGIWRVDTRLGPPAP